VFLAVQLRRIAGRAGTANIESKVDRSGNQVSASTLTASRT
jgi:hypothetical protein